MLKAFPLAIQSTQYAHMQHTKIHDGIKVFSKLFHERSRMKKNGSIPAFAKSLG